MRSRTWARNCSRSAISDTLLPAITEGGAGDGRQVARAGPAARRPGGAADAARRDEGGLGDTAGGGAQAVHGGVGHGLREAGEEERLIAAGQPLPRLAVAQLQQQIVQWDADGAGLPAGAAERGGVGQVFGDGVAFEQRRDHGADGAGIGRAVDMAADLAVDRADVEASAAADAVERLIELGAENLGAAVVEQHEVELFGAVALAGATRASDQVGEDGELLAGAAAR